MISRVLRRGRRRPWWLRGTLLLGIAVFIGLAVLYYLSFRADARLRDALAGLDRDDPGWRLDDIEAARADVPAAENSALVVVAATDLLPDNWPPVEFNDAFSTLSASESLARSEYGRLCNELEEWQPALDEARKLAGLPRGKHRIIYKHPNTWATILPDQQQVRTAAALLRFDALRRCEEGDADGALTDCQAAINAGRSIGDEPLFVSQMARQACDVFGWWAAERVITQREPRRETLASLQQLLEYEDNFSGLWCAARGERACLHEMFMGVESGELSLSSVSGSGHIPAEGLLGPFLHAEVKSEHPEMLSLMTRYAEAGRLPVHEQAAAAAALDAEIHSLPRTAIMTRSMVPAGTNVAKSFCHSHAHMRCLIVCLAVDRYCRAHGHWPAALSDLAGIELTTVPLDPFDGQPLRYRRLPDGVIIYSVGPDGIDNGGVFDAEQRLKPGTDLGICLKRPAAGSHRPTGE